ncbi:DUF1223 domain-containing protein [Mucilaginibacter ginsenosidivorax]|uniref:DUF1223 domain-containing protein n=1 Tax=Mucilaginibacter ginsenosidivorax TaxID=862126 RepID=A0A5B8W0W4_9SPHI|nr:DUF1223 domain-containing protein [Mucilaginibacter ginsenosidivorax]QEC77620.1 DUF1223 domain-containing protein [Mucilaginibacter ginsenosidivorax]
MRSLKVLALIMGLIISALSVYALMGSGKIPAKKDIAKAGGKGFVVLELFTSEGCSSCPPADELLAKIQQQTQGKAVYVLAYHVDYWNRLGWKDVFSNAGFSARQRQYGQWLGGTQIYTPQVIVNGKAEYVGSDETALNSAIADGLATNPAATLILRAQQDGSKLKLQYQTTGAPGGSDVLIALVQKNAQNRVERGENAGRILSHIQIVRKIQTEQLSNNGAGSTTIDLLENFSAQNWEVLCLVQNQNSGEILAASKAGLK